jgi:hypothetical protein
MTRKNQKEGENPSLPSRQAVHHPFLFVTLTDTVHWTLPFTISPLISTGLRDDRWSAHINVECDIAATALGFVGREHSNDNIILCVASRTIDTIFIKVQVTCFIRTRDLPTDARWHSHFVVCASGLALDLEDGGTCGIVSKWQSTCRLLGIEVSTAVGWTFIDILLRIGGVVAFVAVGLGSSK